MRSLRFTAIVLLFVVAVSALLTTQPAEAAGAPAPGRLQGYDTQNLRWLQQSHPSLYSQVEALPWVQDGLSQLERDTIDQLLYIGASDIPSLEATLGLPWVQDAVSEVEYDALDWLSNLGVRDIPNLAAIIAMPFLQTPDTTDVLALRSMHNLAHKEVLVPLIEHAAFLDGISESETTLVTAAGTVYRDPQEVGRMLDPGYATIESSTSETGVQLSIIRTGSQAQVWTAGALSDAVEFAEQTMLLDLPVDHVVLVLSEKAVIIASPGRITALLLATPNRAKRPLGAGNSNWGLLTKLHITTGEETPAGLMRAWPTRSHTCTASTSG